MKHPIQPIEPPKDPALIEVWRIVELGRILHLRRRMGLPISLPKGDIKVNEDYLKYDGRIPEPPYTTESERRIAELEEMLELAANNTAAADLAQEMEYMKAEYEAKIARMRRAWEAYANRIPSAYSPEWDEMEASHAEDTP